MAVGDILGSLKNSVKTAYNNFFYSGRQAPQQRVQEPYSAEARNQTYPPQQAGGYQQPYQQQQLYQQPAYQQPVYQQGAYQQPLYQQGAGMGQQPVFQQTQQQPQNRRDIRFRRYQTTLPNLQYPVILIQYLAPMRLLNYPTRNMYSAAFLPLYKRSQHRFPQHPRGGHPNYRGSTPSRRQRYIRRYSQR